MALAGHAIMLIICTSTFIGLAVRLRQSAKEALVTTIEPSPWEIDQVQLTVGRQLGSGQVQHQLVCYSLTQRSLGSCTKAS